MTRSWYREERIPVAVLGANGLVRRYLPKGSSFKGVGRVRLDQIEVALNNRPHEVLSWRAPLEFIDEILI